MDFECSSPCSQNPASCHPEQIKFTSSYPSSFRSCKWSLPFVFSLIPEYKSLLSHARYMPCPSHCPRFYDPNNIWRGVQTLTLIIEFFSLRLLLLPSYAQVSYVWLTVHRNSVWIRVVLRTHPRTHYLPTGLDSPPAATAHTNMRL